MKRFIFLLAGIVCSAAYVSQVASYQKLSAFWGSFSVVVVAIALAIVGAVIFFVIPWFTNEESAGWGFIVLTTVVCLTAIFGGIYMTEPIERGATVSIAGQILPENPGQHQEYAYANSRAGGRFYSFFYGGGYYSTSSGGSSVPSTVAIPKCTGKACSGVAMVFLAVCAIIVLVGSFFVPHFWVAGGLMFLTFVWMLVIREFYMVSDSPPFQWPSFEKQKRKRRVYDDAIEDDGRNPWN